MAKNQEVEVKEVEAVETPKVEIIRGRMPVAVVAMIRFNEVETTTSACAAKYRTTVGKVDDIKKGRNFGYVDEEFQPTAEQVEQAKGYIAQLEDADSILEALDAMGVAESAEAFEAKRSAARKTTKKVEAEGTDEAADVVEDADLDELVD